MPQISRIEYNVFDRDHNSHESFRVNMHGTEAECKAKAIAAAEARNAKDPNANCMVEQDIEYYPDNVWVWPEAS